MTDAKIKGQIGQPAAWMIDHTTCVSSMQSVHSSLVAVVRQAAAAKTLSNAVLQTLPGRTTMFELALSARVVCLRSGVCWR